MENIIKYTDFLNEKQLEFAFMDDIRKQEEIEAEMERMAVERKKMEEERKKQLKFFRDHIVNVERLDDFLSLNPTKEEISDMLSDKIKLLKNVEDLLKYHEEKKMEFRKDHVEKMRLVIPALKKLIAKMKTL